MLTGDWISAARSVAPKRSTSSSKRSWFLGELWYWTLSWTGSKSVLFLYFTYLVFCFILSCSFSAWGASSSIFSSFVFGFLKLPSFIVLENGTLFYLVIFSSPNLLLMESFLCKERVESWDSIILSSVTSLWIKLPKLFTYLIPFLLWTSPLTPMVGGNSIIWSPLKNSSFANEVSVPVLTRLGLSSSTSSWHIVKSSSDPRYLKKILQCSNSIRDLEYYLTFLTISLKLLTDIQSTENSITSAFFFALSLLTSYKPWYSTFICM